MKEELHRQLPPVRGYPAHSAHASPPHPPLQTSKMSPFGQYPCFFSQCPKFRLILGIGNASFCFMPKISRLFEFFPEKTKIFGYWRKKAAYIPNLVIRPPTPYPPQKRKYAKKAARQTRFPVCRAAALLSYSVSRRLSPPARGLPPYSQAPARQLFCRRSLLCLRSSSSSAFSVGDPEYDLIAVDLKRQLLTL